MVLACYRKHSWQNWGSRPGDDGIHLMELSPDAASSASLHPQRILRETLDSVYLTENSQLGEWT